MSKKAEVFGLIKQIIYSLSLLITKIFKIISKELGNLYHRFIEKLRFSLTLKITLVYARKTLSVLWFFTLFIIVGFMVFSGWNAQEQMKRDLYLLSHGLSDEVKFPEEKIKKLAELDNLFITIFDEQGGILYTTEKKDSSIVFYEKKDSKGVFAINNNFILVRDEDPVKYNLIGALKGKDYNFGYAMILREEIQWNNKLIHVQIKNRMIREIALLILIGLGLLAINLFHLLTILVSGSRSSKKILRPIEVMTKTVENITINDLNTRLSISGSQDELKDLARTFNGMLDRIQESYEQQNQFVSDASHELRTPISVIQGYVDLLIRWGKDDEKILEESLAAIKEESMNMKDLVEKLLFLARGDKNTQKVEKSDFYLNKLVDEVIRETKMIDHSHEIISHKNEEILINGDPRLIKEALRIFIDNSMKYTPSGGKIIIESLLNGNDAQISVEDTGVGISKEDLPHIFNRFYRIDKSRTKGIEGVGGTGLGLPIAKWIIQAHKGGIKIESQINKGTKVIVKLPRNIQK